MKKKLLLAAIFISFIAGFFIFDLGRYFDLAFLKSAQADIQNYHADNPLLSVLFFFLTYVLITALSLPAASIMTLAAGAIFGVLTGTVLVSFASTAGATLAFLAARFLFRDFIQQRFADKLQAINRGVEKDGALYLFTLRLVPAFPFFIINLVMALTPIRTLTFALVSQAGMLAATIVYVNAGTQLAQIDSPSDILSAQLVASFVLLGLFPLLAKKAVSLFRQQHAPPVEDADND